MMKIGTDELTEFRYHSQILRYGLKDGALLWGDSTPIQVTLPQFSDTTNLTTYLKSKYPFDFVFEVTNTLNQPSLISGTLNGVSLTLINEGTISGTNPGDDGLTIQAPMTLVDNGVIRGAGGNGGKGGKGGNGGKGGKGKDSTKTIRSTVNKSETRAGSYGRNAVVNRQCTNVTQIVWGSDDAGACCLKHIAYTWSNGPFTLSGYPGSKFYRKGFRYEHKGPNAICSTKGYDLVYDIQRTWTETTTKTIKYTGGAGGNGGGGGAASTTVGRGASFNTSMTTGRDGVPGANGQSGSPSTPAGGHSGGAGGKGGHGGLSGDGGTWGVDGVDGQVGTKGGTGKPGAGGGASGLPGTNGAGYNTTNGPTYGSSAGTAIVGSNFLNSASAISDTTTVLP